jgi:succinate dehydrogenase / fumarate reductase cytochrome b subunit
MTSSIGKKLIMSLTGLFLITFLVAHLSGNLQLLAGDGGQSFNIYAKFMTTFPLVKIVSYGLYAGILLHAIQGIMIWLANKQAAGKKYAKSPDDGTSWASKNMAMLGLLILVFLGIHMGDFWFSMKFGDLPMVEYDGVQYRDLYSKVDASFSQVWIIGIYVISMIGLALHLMHGFGSAFQTLGLNHKKYTPAINFVGVLFSIIIPLMFAIIPVLMYFDIEVPALNFLH